VAGEGAGHLDAPAVFRVDEVGADQEQDQLGALQAAVDLARPVVAGEELAVVPGLDQPLPLQELQALLQADAETVVLVGVAEEDAKGLGHPPIFTVPGRTPQAGASCCG
jgi:hypothetical protein